VTDAIDRTARQVHTVGGNDVHKLMHADHDPDTGRRYWTGCGHLFYARFGAMLTTRPATCDWCTA
jgi:hypothetical protein